MRSLQAYVRDLGGGLVVIGGPSSFGVGGYYDTRWKKTLPVEMQLRDKERNPQLTLLFVIDRSGSMQIAAPSGVSNLERRRKRSSLVRAAARHRPDRRAVLRRERLLVLEVQEVATQPSAPSYARGSGRCGPEAAPASARGCSPPTAYCKKTQINSKT